VPYFLIGLEPGSGSRPYGLSGAQPASALVRIFRELASSASASADEGDAAEGGDDNTNENIRGGSGR
jgi:predicted DsbA family dithiol-disulfide isomerase